MEPMLSLAISVQKNPGVYAILLGSGVSRAAGIPTGWEVVLDLIRQIARIKRADCEPEPDRWYRETFDKEPGYSDLLALIARSAPERQQVLRRYFEPTDEEREQGLKVPTDAHRAIAELVAGGFIRVIVTTNFDRLLEQALQAVGIYPTVVSTADAIKGALPLAHSRCTVVKLHGDYLDTRILNTPDELASYADAINNLLDQVFDEYGLIVSGWSAEWDPALCAAIERTPTRRFATYWVYPQKVTDAARRLIDLRQAVEVPGQKADPFFRRLAEDVRSLEDLGRPHPLSVGVAAETAKRYLVDEQHRIRLYDLVMAEANRIHDAVSDESAFPLDREQTPEEIAKRLGQFQALSEVLTAVMATGGWWGEQPHHETWARCLERLSNLPAPRGSYTDLWKNLRSYPALLAAYAAGIAAMAKGRYDTLASVLTTPRVVQPYQEDGVPFLIAVNAYDVMDYGDAHLMLGGQGSLLSFHEHLCSDSGLREAVRDFLPDDRAFVRAFDRFEFFLGLVYWDLRTTIVGRAWAPMGCFRWRYGARFDVGQIRASKEISSEVSAAGADWAPLRVGLFGGRLARFQVAMTGYDEFIREWRPG